MEAVVRRDNRRDLDAMMEHIPMGIMIADASDAHIRAKRDLNLFAGRPGRADLGIRYAGAVNRHLLGNDLGPRQREILLEPGAQLLRDAGHDVERRRAAHIKPMPKLLHAHLALPRRNADLARGAKGLSFDEGMRAALAVDADPATSEGVFVFTSAAPPASLRALGSMRITRRLFTSPSLRTSLGCSMRCSAISEIWIRPSMSPPRRAKAPNLVRRVMTPSTSCPTLYFSTRERHGSLFGLQESNPVETLVAYKGPSTNYGKPNDPMVGRKIGGVNVFGGGLALYDSAGNLHVAYYDSGTGNLKYAKRPAGSTTCPSPPPKDGSGSPGAAWAGAAPRSDSATRQAAR